MNKKLKRNLIVAGVTIGIGVFVFFTWKIILILCIIALIAWLGWGVLL